MTLLFQTIIPFLVLIAVLIAIHEGGHYAAARYYGVAVKRFSLGMGPIILRRKDQRGTEWALSCLPIGGYVYMIEQPEQEHDLVGCAYKTLNRWQRSVILLAGPLVNLIFGFLLMLVVCANVQVETTPPVIGNILENSPAEKAGLQAGDRILSINGTKIETFSQIPEVMLLNLEKPIELTYARGGVIEEISIIPRKIVEKTSTGRRIEHGQIGVRSPTREWRDPNWNEVPMLAYTRSKNALIGTTKAISQIIVGERAADSLQGMIGMAQTTGSAFVTQDDDGNKEYHWMGLIALGSLLSLNLALLNLFPLPVLDGGQVLVLISESIIRRDLPEKIKNGLYLVGATLIGLLFLFTTFQDIQFLS